MGIFNRFEAVREYGSVEICCESTEIKKWSAGLQLTLVEVTLMNANSDPGDITEQELLRLSTDIVASFVSNNTVAPTVIPELIRSVHDSLSQLGKIEPPPRQVEKQKPAVPIAKSVQQDYIVCLEDGKKLKMLKRYLRSKYNLSPDEYRRKWGLPADYPMVAPAYANRRSEFAKQIGLGKGVRRQKP
jgi:predicted transcriptional regulator